MNNPELSAGEVYAIERIIGNMSNAEKAVAVRSIPTEILQNEVTRRLKRDNANLKGLKELVSSMESY